MEGSGWSWRGQHPVGGAGLAALGRDGHAGGRAGRAPDGRVHRPAVLGHVARHQGQVAPRHRAGRQLGHERAVGGVGAGHRQQARGAPVEAVDDPRPPGVPDLRRPPQVRVAGQQARHQGARRPAGPGVDHQAGRLVHHHDLRRPRGPPRRRPRARPTGSRSAAGGTSTESTDPSRGMLLVVATAPSTRTLPSATSPAATERETPVSMATARSTRTPRRRAGTSNSAVTATAPPQGGAGTAGRARAPRPP